MKRYSVAQQTLNIDESPLISDIDKPLSLIKYVNINDKALDTLKRRVLKRIPIGNLDLILEHYILKGYVKKAKLVLITIIKIFPSEILPSGDVTSLVYLPPEKKYPTDILRKITIENIGVGNIEMTNFILSVTTSINTAENENIILAKLLALVERMADANKSNLVECLWLVYGNENMYSIAEQYGIIIDQDNEETHQKKVLEANVKDIKQEIKDILKGAKRGIIRNGKLLYLYLNTKDPNAVRIFYLLTKEESFEEYLPKIFKIISTFFDKELKKNVTDIQQCVEEDKNPIYIVYLITLILLGKTTRGSFPSEKNILAMDNIKNMIDSGDIENLIEEASKYPLSYKEHKKNYYSEGKQNDFVKILYAVCNDEKSSGIIKNFLF